MNGYLAATQDPATVIAITEVTLLGVIGLVVYLIPVMVAMTRHTQNRWQVLIVDLLLGWTGIGWIVALVMAFQTRPPAWQPPPPGRWQPYR